MLPPVFYVQQLEQILLRKLLSPPTPANPARFAFCPRRALISVFNFFVRFSRSVFRVKPCPFGLVRLRCAPLSFPAPRARPSHRICAYIHIQFFVRFFRAKLRPLISDLARLRCAPDALISIFSFCQPFPFQAAPLWLRVRHILFSRFSVFLRPVFPPVL